MMVDVVVVEDMEIVLGLWTELKREFRKRMHGGRGC